MVEWQRFVHILQKTRKCPIKKKGEVSEVFSVNTMMEMEQNRAGNSETLPTSAAENLPILGERMRHF